MVNQLFEILKQLSLNDLGNALIALPIIIVGNILFGLASGSIQYGFDKEKFKLGLVKGVSMYGGILMLVLVSIIMVDLKVALGGSEYGLIDAMYIIVYGAIGNYAFSAIVNLKSLLNYKGDE